MATPADGRKSVFQSADQTVLQRCFCWFLHLNALPPSVEQHESTGSADGLAGLDNDMLL